MWVEITRNWQCFHQDEEYVFGSRTQTNGNQTGGREADVTQSSGWLLTFCDAGPTLH